MVGGKQNFELHLNEIEINKIIDCILLHKNADESEKNAVYKLENLRDIQIKEVDFDNLYVEN